MAQAEVERLSVYNARQRASDIASIALFFGLTPILLMKLADLDLRNDGIPNSGWIVLAAFFAGLLFADWSSGFFHWAADNWGKVEWPVLGTHLLRPFRHHHADPNAMCLHDFVELNGNSCFVSLVAFWWADLCIEGLTPAWGLFGGAFFLSTCYWVFGTNQFHAWAHAVEPPRLVRWLQRARLILTPEHHAQHHAFPHNRNYGITNGWTNPVMRALRFYEIIEWTVTRLTGIQPMHKKILLVHASQTAVPSEQPS